MKKEYKDKWVEALRSRNYKQGRSCLYNDRSDTYCCLGVISKECGFSLRHFVTEQHSTPKSTINLNDTKKIGLNQSVMWDLIKLNDEDKWSFDQIADYIETHL